MSGGDPIRLSVAALHSGFHNAIASDKARTLFQQGAQTFFPSDERISPVRSRQKANLVFHSLVQRGQHRVEIDAVDFGGFAHRFTVRHRAA